MLSHELLFLCQYLQAWPLHALRPLTEVLRSDHKPEQSRGRFNDGLVTVSQYKVILIAQNGA